MSRKHVKIAAMALFFFSTLHPAVFCEESTADLKNEIEELRLEQKALHEELKMIRDILLKGPGGAQKQANVRDVEFELGNNPVMGTDSAPLVMVEFSDYQCSFCARHTKETYPEIFENYVKTGKIRYAFVDKPLPSHDKADEAAEAAHCAAEQGKYWEMHKEMLLDSDSLDDLTTLASSIGLDVPEFKNCMETKKYSGTVAENLSLAERLSVPSVPGFVIASRDPDNPKRVKGISYIRGAQPYAQFQKEIDRALAALSE